MTDSQIALVREQLALPTARRRQRAGIARRGLRVVALLAVLTAGATTVDAQGPYRQDLLPGLAGFDAGNKSSPAVADLDADGDLDVVIGGQPSFGSFRYLENTGSATDPAFADLAEIDNPFALVFANRAALALGDLDADGDLDAVVGQYIGMLRYWANTGSSTAPGYVELTGSENPFLGLSVGSTSKPALADLDGDGDLDAVVGEAGGTLRYWANTGSSSAPAFVEATGSANPLSSFDVGLLSAPALADLDGDGDVDALVGERYGSLFYFTNTGSSTAPAFVEATGSANPLTGFGVESTSAPVLADLDAIVGEDEGTLRTFANTGSSSAPLFAEVTGTERPFTGFDVGGTSTLALVDLDADNDLDAVVGSSVGALAYFIQTGTATAPAYAEATGTENPFSAIAVGILTAPALADLDADGDFDIAVSEYYGTLSYFRNTGSSTAPSYTEATGTQNPFSGLNAGYRGRPVLADLDADGDIDLVIGHLGGDLRYFPNTGSSTAAAYVEATGAANPFSGLDVSLRSAPALADLDRDGDLDAVVGNNLGQLRYFRNTGSSTSPGFVEISFPDNPLFLFDVGYNSTPVLADLDGDGDLDVVVGERGGSAMFLRSFEVVFKNGFETGDTSAWSQTVP